MHPRHWILIACVVSGLGCGNDRANDGTAGDYAVPADTRGDVDASTPSVVDSSKPGVVDPSKPSDVDASKPSVVDPSKPAGEQDGGTGTGGTSGTQDAGAVSGGGADCVWDVTNPNHCKVCAADATCEAPKYTDNTNGTVTSSCCGLVWQQLVDYKGGNGKGGYTHGEATAYCAGLALAGAGWRLPTMPELVSLVVLGQTPPDPTIDRSVFPNTPSGPYDSFWSSSPFAGATDNVWVIYSFNAYANGIMDANYPHHVRCVR